MIGFKTNNDPPDWDYFLIAPEKYPQEFCMARNVFFEASIDSSAGMAAVADVVLTCNGIQLSNTVCEETVAQ